MAEPAPLDASLIADLRDQIGDEAVRDILGRFAANGRQLIPVILDVGRAVVERGEAAHSLKGACAVVGMTRLCDLCQQIENAWRAGSGATAEGLAARLPALFDADRGLLEKLV